MNASQPSDFILQSFNAFSPAIAGAPDQILNNLSNYVNTIKPALITTQTSEQQFTGTFHQSSSAEQTQTNFAVSVGISGSYGFYSGSVQASASSETYQSATSYHCSFQSVVNCGSVYYNQGGNMDGIRACLQPVLLTALDSIHDNASAAAFVEQFGTHLVLGVALGGAIYISTVAGTTSLDSQSTVSAAVSAKYNAVSSASATATATYSLATQFASQDYGYTINTIGGSSAATASLNVADPATYSTWANTCTPSTVYEVKQTMELWQLATAGGNARTYLQLYVQTKVLMQSLNHPSHFSNTIAVLPYQENRVTASAAGADFKIIGGGVSVTRDSNNFLLGSYPVQDQTGKITGWAVVSHDLSAPSVPGDLLTAYAIGIYDPNNLLKVSCVSSQGTNPAKGIDSATATLTGNAVLTGGGAVGIVNSGNAKFQLQSYPSASNSWTGMISDYHNAASNVPLTVYAIGVFTEHLAITQQLTQQSMNNIQHGNAVATAVTAIAGGGVRVESKGDGNGNLVQQSCPASANTWAEYDKDTAGSVTHANVTAYAIQLTATQL
jgi:hypothetical protein